MEKGKVLSRWRESAFEVAVWTLVIGAGVGAGALGGYANWLPDYGTRSTKRVDISISRPHVSKRQLPSQNCHPALRND
jgi:hypothetical protein